MSKRKCFHLGDPVYLLRHTYFPPTSFAPASATKSYRTINLKQNIRKYHKNISPKIMSKILTKAFVSDAYQYRCDAYQYRISNELR